MAKDELQIKISDPYLDSVKVVREEIGEIKKSFSWIMTFVIGALLIGFLTMLFMVAGLVVDSWRFHSTIYKENKILDLNSKIVNEGFNQQKDILDRLDKIETKIKK